MYPPYQIPILLWWWTFLCGSVARIIILLYLKYDSGSKSQPTFGLWRNRDSSICTTTPGPPKIMGMGRSLVVQISLSHRYTSTAVPLSTTATLCASFTGYCCDHQKIKISHFCRESLDFAKKLPSLMDFEVLHLWHRHLNPSEISFRCLSTMATPHLHVWIIHY